MVWRQKLGPRPETSCSSIRLCVELWFGYDWGGGGVSRWVGGWFGSQGWVGTCVMLAVGMLSVAGWVGVGGLTSKDEGVAPTRRTARTVRTGGLLTPLTIDPLDLGTQRAQMNGVGEAKRRSSTGELIQILTRTNWGEIVEKCPGRDPTAGCEAKENHTTLI